MSSTTPLYMDRRDEPEGGQIINTLKSLFPADQYLTYILFISVYPISILVVHPLQYLGSCLTVDVNFYNTEYAIDYFVLLSNVFVFSSSFSHFVLLHDYKLNIPNTQRID